MERFLLAFVFDCVTRFLLDFAAFLFLAVRLAVDFLPRVFFFFVAALALGDAFFLVFAALVVEVFDFVDFLPEGLPNAFSQLLEYLVVVPE